MSRLIVLSMALACCNAFLAPLPILKIPQSRRVEMDHSKRALLMTASSSSTQAPDASSEAHGSLKPFDEAFSGQIDRRSLLKAIPATLAVGAAGMAVIGMPEQVSARASPKAAAPGTNVVVLGGNGFVGSKVCEVLVEAGDVGNLCPTNVRVDHMTFRGSRIHRVQVI